ncbi:prephenate dehydrogenase [Arthrobacter sp. TES]|uniref:prephenate dehydrogenase n=1 Tax=Paenarthrobacter ureafaciens TaxID=37931 RepID=UPI0003973C84|nr:prephenate dehydrogenase [Paenarthrobacter ureafaciens]AOY71849.1 prephenate dehydrogenase [Arthrobacter sp. ZXY-2]ERI36684.1 prephenate dehydrogenase [Arthrobacter sp. AK-YN10]QOI63656.1 prephenate dehydrogenase [Arthrobacter sp. TES]GLU61029.1 prephenate dehydrogenase [Paenarthrobacter ureafaciens]GLU65299.1 prephenate dehydrogenase [Paenarthrobacter ureafaciens]
MSAFRAHGRGHLDGPVVILGTGLLGASIGLGLRGRGVPVFLFDTSPTNQAVAVDIGAGRPLEELDGPPQLVVVAAPPDVTAQVVEKALADYPESVVVDIASVKAGIQAELRERGVDLCRYVGTHPMAGREKSGPVAARGELFTSMPWVICPTEETGAAALQVARSLAGDLGAIVSQFTADEHDEAVALVSHLPQIMSSLLASRLQGTPLHALSLAGNGLRDTTRIAASDPTLWVQILGGNAEKVVNILHGVREDLNRLIGTLESPLAPGARLDLAQLISEGNAGQARIPGKHGGPPQAYSWLTILVDDKPGQIARLLTEIGEVGVNVEDLRLDHSSGQNVGMVELSVLPNKHDLLVEALTDRGWRVLQ